jgi:hypothetical protein
MMFVVWTMIDTTSHPRKSILFFSDDRIIPKHMKLGTQFHPLDWECD